MERNGKGGGAELREGGRSSGKAPGRQEAHEVMNPGAPGVPSENVPQHFLSDLSLEPLTAFDTG